ncbi:hypothetical protein [Yinghuangia seranimata]|uniref:hypothetical protein n=1 Tax=Yinghuangia seranimata TaxID=408067 RepID=UPI00248BBBBD|nr:hypothetical protein [Yinghuangia seranimata]MDI2127540.1 hypothetical protein [Yinghuangia seranimata]
MEAESAVPLGNRPDGADGAPAGADSLVVEELPSRQRRMLLALAVAAVVVPAALGALAARPEAGHLLTAREAWFLAHVLCGVVIVHAFAGGLATLTARRMTPVKDAVRLLSTVSLAVVSWLTVVSGTWLVYPGYRAKPAPGGDTTDYPQAYLAAHDLDFWHDFGMEWKEHVGWVTPLLATAVAFVAFRYPHVLNRNARTRATATTYFVVAFAAAVVAAGLGTAINAVAPNGFLDQ